MLDSAMTDGCKVLAANDKVPKRQKNHPDLTYELSIIESTLLSGLMVLLLRERVPEPERLVASTGNNGLAFGTHREIQNTMRMSGERGDHVKRGILPDADLILRGSGREPMCGNNLVRRQ